MSYTQVNVHIVFSTKARIPIISPEIERSIFPIIVRTIQEYGGYVYELNGSYDHIHILIAAPPDKSLSTLVGVIKRKTSYHLRYVKHITEWRGWCEGFGAFSCSQRGINAISRYIKNQKIHHKYSEFVKECSKLCKAHTDLNELRKNQNNA